ncbi:MAG: trypsin-like peptidase domain-containing protein [Hamadaea sp.]|uniref:trypsin-like peptidase domain-containing protein n=1 Tax=Hamadaea sp. TaxID=2024425 RepID=UPI001840355B|nr:trypsin-like peptidase domain-containing protein [Hamadaea sp.]NUT22822.1 trypsin-like peptidase domain-containing protein [Hamadaea sp.]
MSFRRVLKRRAGALLPATLAALCATLGTAVPAGWAAPAYTLEERALAISSPSLVFIEELYTGYLRDKTTHTAVVASPITYARRCSGFVVNSDGFVVTPASCVKLSDEAIRTGALYEAAEIQIKAGKLQPNQVDGYVQGHRQITEFTGLSAGTEPEARIFGQINVATAGLADSPAIPGQLVGLLEKNDVAIVKLQQGNLPAVELQTGDPASQGAALQALGFATTDADARSAAFTPTSKSVQVTGTGKIGELPFSKINGDLGPYSNGGMAVDSSGRVVGMLNYDWTAQNPAVRAITPSSAIAEALSNVQLANTLSATDKQYRDALDAYFRGDYSAAIAQFDSVIAAVPANKTAAVYRQQAIDRQSIEADSSAIPVWVWIAGAAVVVILLVGIIVMAILLGRRRRPSDEAELLIPVSLNPFAPTSSAPFSAPPGPGPAAIYPGPPGVPVPMPPSVNPQPESANPQSAPPAQPVAAPAQPLLPGQHPGGPAYPPAVPVHPPAVAVQHPAAAQQAAGPVPPAVGPVQHQPQPVQHQPQPVQHQPQPVQHPAGPVPPVASPPMQPVPQPVPPVMPDPAVESGAAQELFVWPDEEDNLPNQRSDGYDGTRRT